MLVRSRFTLSDAIEAAVGGMQQVLTWAIQSEFTRAQY